MSGDELKLREIILNTRKPIVLENFNLNWKCTKGSLDDWCLLFDQCQNEAEIEFEQMQKKSKSQQPQWESERKTIKMNMKQFLGQHKNQNQEFWSGLNYKTPDEIPKECKAGIDFSCFGFPHLVDDYARFWLSSSGANTPCHQDTYGCNIVVQIYGSKSWLLFPPTSPLTTTRLPYEESSIYCLENFYAPAMEQIKDLQRLKSDAYLCRLNAGQVLIVPRHWWHFVETVELSLSINTWIPLEVDAEAQFEECIVKYLMETIVQKENDEVRKHLLNPNQKDLSPEEEVLNILAYLEANTRITKEEKAGKKKEISYSYQYLDEENVELLLKEFGKGKFLEKANCSEYDALIARNATRFVNSTAEAELSPIRDIKKTLINSICSRSVIKEIAREFRNRNSRNNG